MTTDSIHYQTDNGVRYALTPKQEGTLQSYVVTKDGKYPFQYDRLDLSVHTDLPWANPDSLLFSAMPKNQGLFGLSEAIARIRKRKILVAKRTADMSALQDSFPSAFKPDINTQVKLLEVFRAQAHRACLHEEILMGDIRRYSITLVANAKLSDVISLTNWTALYHLIQDAPIPKKLKCTLSQWQWLHTLEIPELYRYYQPMPDSAWTDLEELLPAIQTTLDVCSCRTLRDFMRFLLDGYPVDVTLAIIAKS